LASDYTSEHHLLSKFYQFTPDAEGIDKAIGDRQKFPVSRPLLVESITRQYGDLDTTEAVNQNIQLLLSNDTFTVTTAHQPNLMTGYLYFIYKILHAIKLTEQLSTKHPDKKFVPVYYMGSEDNDLDELGTFKFRDDRYTWDGGGQKGAVGRMDTSTLKPLLQQLFRFWGPPGPDADQLQKVVTTAYTRYKTMGGATRYLVNELFGKYGLVIVDPDDAALKSAFIPVMEDELLHSPSIALAQAQTQVLEQNYKSQLFPRPINLFYLLDGVRERIERQEDTWVVLNTDYTFSREALLTELHQHPERFSPNVVLRPAFQCAILPDVVFIGGGAEVAYWLQLKTVFSHHDIFYPAILLRQSVLWLSKQQAELRKRTGLSISEMFRSEHDLINDYIAAHSEKDWHTSKESEDITRLMQQLEEKAATIDPTLRASVKAAATAMGKKLTALEKKMLRAEKRNHQVHIDRISRMKAGIFPGNSLQERTDNFLELYLEQGPSFIDTVYAGINPLTPAFMVIE
jgi:bacillithiol biosynthesis cysteine-adding enzyme BshC